MPLELCFFKLKSGEAFAVNPVYIRCLRDAGR